MAICLFNHESDVYVFYDPRGSVICGSCSLLSTKSLSIKDLELNTEAEMLKHLWEHVGAGHKVPSFAFEKLLKVFPGDPNDIPEKED